MRLSIKTGVCTFDVHQLCDQIQLGLIRILTYPKHCQIRSIT